MNVTNFPSVFIWLSDYNTTQHNTTLVIDIVFLQHMELDTRPTQSRLTISSNNRKDVQTTNTTDPSYSDWRLQEGV